MHRVHRLFFSPPYFLQYLSDFVGEPQETEEMLPSWYDVKKIPYEKMWEDDSIWIPEMLRGENVNYHFKFTHEGKMISYDKDPAES
jgi:hypothetical protein